MKPLQLQQGDVMLEQILFIPKTAIKKTSNQNKQYILAHGESNHYHAVEEEDGVEFYELNGTLFLKTEKEVELTHQEHNTITIKPGIYKIGRVREMDYTSLMERTVAD